MGQLAPKTGPAAWCKIRAVDAELLHSCSALTMKRANRHQASGIMALAETVSGFRSTSRFGQPGRSNSRDAGYLSH